MIVHVNNSNSFVVCGQKHVSMKCLKSPIHLGWTNYMFKLDTFLVFYWTNISSLVLRVENDKQLRLV